MVTERGSGSRRERFRVELRPPRRADEAPFLAAAKASRQLHGSWVQPPLTAAAYASYVRRYGSRSPKADHAGYLAARIEDGTLAGVFNFSQIVRGALCSAYLGYYAFAPLAGGGLMTEGFVLALDAAFRELRLHRVEVNVRPENARSIALVERIGLTREGYSRRYLKLAGRWRDHARFAMLAEDWRLRKPHLLAALRSR
jgi:ribosomal-protein-alanine N-acetyltransferase